MKNRELQEAQQTMNNLSTDIGTQVSQQDPFVAWPEPDTANSPSHLNSSGSSINSCSSTPSKIARPIGMTAEGGTYHGCTLLFETFIVTLFAFVVTLLAFAVTLFTFAVALLTYVKAFQ
uniref:Uncharacterized protein n=1 Tax=Bionectria ochroleuca TaxID=29856 RepID=A0A8H7NHZ3_BIOOC